MSAVVERSVETAVDAVRAYAAFGDVDAWWPRELTWTGDDRAHLDLVVWPGGRATETGPGGFRLDWATVLACETPSRLELAWQIGPDRVPIPDAARASRAVLSFADGRVDVRHAFDDADHAEAMGPGWEHLLARFAEHAAREPADTVAAPRAITANLPVSDMEAATAALVDLLDLRTTMDLGWVKRLECATGALQLVEEAEHDPAVSINVADADAAHARAHALGLDVTYALRTEPWGVRRFWLRLPGGATVNVVGHA